MNIIDITVLEPKGPGSAGLAELPPIPAENLVSGKPVQKGYRYYEEQKTGLRAGVWACTPFQTKMEPHAVHEFMHITEGSVIIVHEDGSELKVSAGERFFIPKGTMRSWKQTEPVRKYFMIFPDPSGASAGDATELRAFKIESAPKPKAGNGDDASAVIPIYRDPTAQYSVGIWHPARNGNEGELLAATEMLLPVDGSLTLLGADGEYSLAPGDVALVPAGARMGWRNSESASVIYCAFKGN
jgi:uncharacterized cupin superfamily protein